MKIDVTPQELEEVIQALKGQAQQRRAAGERPTVTEELVARLEVCQGEQRREEQDANR